VIELIREVNGCFEKGFENFEVWNENGRFVMGVK
jgi:hypothetical protein